MQLPGKTYEIIRWLVAIVLPALTVLIETVAPLWIANFPTEAVTISLTAFDLFLGTIFGIAKISYDKAQAIEAKTEKKQGSFTK